MSGPSRSQVAEPATRVSTSRHRTVHSLTTNASGIADSTISYGTVDALHSQLGHFPPPPSELPTPTTPTSPAFLISAPAVHIAPLRLPQRNPHPDVPSETSQGPQQQHHPPIHYPPEEPIPPNGSLRPLRRQPSFNTYATGGTVGSLSPFDWHEGSSSIDVHPHDDRMLPTSFITSLISSSEHGSPRSNPAMMTPVQNSAQLFSGGNDQDAISTSSDATYPPHNYPPTPSPNKAIPPGAAYLESSGRSSKTSSVGMTTLDTGRDEPSVLSHTPLVHPTQRYEPIEEDTVGELQARGESPKHSSGPNSPWRTFRDRRQSLASTRTTKSYVSSLISKLSRVTSRRQATPKPLPPLPTIPAELRNQEYRKFEESMPLPQLANRADVLSKMLAKGHTPDSGDRSPSNRYQSMPSTGVDIPWNGVTQIQETSRSNWPGVHDVYYKYHSEGEKEVTPDRPVGFWERLTTRFGKKRIIMMLLVIAALLIVLAALLGVLLRKKSITPELPKCPAGRTGTDCDISTSIFPLIFLQFWSYLSRVFVTLLRADPTFIPTCPQMRVVCVLVDHRARVWPRGYLTCFPQRTRPLTQISRLKMWQIHCSTPWVFRRITTARTRRFSWIPAPNFVSAPPLCGWHGLDLLCCGICFRQPMPQRSHPSGSSSIGLISSPLALTSPSRSPATRFRVADSCLISRRWVSRSRAYRGRRILKRRIAKRRGSRIP